jgi:Zn-dependent protease
MDIQPLANKIADILVQAFVILFAITVHEVAHGWIAKKRGDPTAYEAGRVTLNPLVHIDIIGTILVPLILILSHGPVFGWAKFVPHDPRRLRHPRRDRIWISLAGPASNLAVAVVTLIPFLLIKPLAYGTASSALLAKSIVAIFLILHRTILINAIFAVINLIPLPPFDGSWIVEGLLPKRVADQYASLRPYGMIIMMAIFLSPIPSYIISPVWRVIDNLAR